MSTQLNAPLIRKDNGWEPSPLKIQVGRYLVADGKNLPNSVTEDVIGVSLCRRYPKKQLRRIKRRYSTNHMFDSQNTIQKAAKNKFDNRHLRLRRVFIEEGMW